MLHPHHFLTLLIITVVAAFILFFRATSGIDLWGSNSSPRPNLKHPDFKQYIDLRVLSPQEFPIDDPLRRVIIVGDIHGKKKPLQHLLDKVAYDSQKDVLVHTGDIFVRGQPHGTLKVIDFLTTYNVTGVRGNHDQKVIGWKAWLNWFETLPGGGEWLLNLESKWQQDHHGGQSLKGWVKAQRRESQGEDAKWWSTIPHKWIPFGVHFHIAQALTQEQYAYLLSLPLKLHIPSAHAFVVHAGLLPYDVRFDFDDRKRQPLARIPRVRSFRPPYSKRKIQALRTLQELEIAYRVPQNTDPWNNLNMRSILKSNKVTRDWMKGTPWTVYWNDQMTMCNGFPEDTILQTQDQQFRPTVMDKSLSCYPASIIYGHSAGRGLDVNRWTFGLDTGCAYGRQLTAIILGPNPLPNETEWEEEEAGESINDDLNDFDGDWIESDDSLDEDEFYDVLELEDSRVEKFRRTFRTVKFGEHGNAKLVQVPCS